MNNLKVSVYAELLEKAKGLTLTTAASVAEGDRLLQLKEGKATPLWLVGHLANTINMVVSNMLLGEKGVVPPARSELFLPASRGGEAPTTDPDRYPSWDEVVVWYETAMTAAIEGVRTLTDDQLPSPLPEQVPEDIRSFFQTFEITFMIMVNHDAHHRGQLALLAQLGGAV